MARIRGSDLRQVRVLLLSLLEDPDLVSQLSLIEKEHLEGAAASLRSLLPFADARDLEDTVNES